MKNLLAWLIALALGPLPLGCASAQTQRDACYDAMDKAYEVRAEMLCPGGGKAWDACPHRKQVLDELAASYRKCP